MRTLFALIATVGLIGCVGGIQTTPTTDDPDPGGVGGGGSGSAATDAKRLFETNVYPILGAAARNCQGCHTNGSPQGNITGFYSPDLSTAYVTAVGYQALVGDWTPTGAPILQKIMGPNKTASHQSITYSNDEVNKVTEWLNKELEARGAGTGGGSGTETAGQVTQRLLEEWSGCMTLTNFEAADLRQMGNSQSNEGRCRTCHNGGEYNFIASDTSTPFFDVISQNKYYMLQYFSIDLSQGLEAATVIVNTRSFEGVGNGLAPHQAHPQFDPNNINGTQALQNFYDTTMAAKTAAPNGVCGPKKLTN